MSVPPTLDECVQSGKHRTDVDFEGHCTFCGYRNETDQMHPMVKRLRALVKKIMESGVHAGLDREAWQMYVEPNEEFVTPERQYLNTDEWKLLFDIMKTPLSEQKIG